MAQGYKTLATFRQPESLTAVLVVWDTEYQEFICEVYEAGEHLEELDYFTDDKQDALDTAKVMSESLA